MKGSEGKASARLVPSSGTHLRKEGGKKRPTMKAVAVLELCGGSDGQGFRAGKRWTPSA